MTARIERIKRHRGQHSCGLLEAKTAIDMEDQLVEFYNRFGHMALFSVLNHLWRRVIKK